MEKQSPIHSIRARRPAGRCAGQRRAAAVSAGRIESRSDRAGRDGARGDGLAEAKTEEFCDVVAMNSPVAKKVFSAKKITAPTEAEALVLVQSEIEGRPVLLAVGTDERGLVYALTELADRVSCLQTTRAALEFSTPVIERPANRTRSVMRGFNSEVEDKVWFYDRDCWRAYLTMLVYSRLNRMSFTTGMGYNSVISVTDGYLIFPYPFFVAVPGFDVRAKGLSDEERGRKLEMLKFIGEECARRGLRFQLGIWTLAYEWTRSPKATYAIEGLTDATHGAYCRNAFSILLKLEWSLAPTMNRIQWGKVDYSRNGRDFNITDPLVQVKNPALEAGVRLPGFNDDFAGSAPDIGAFENGRPPLRFGREMAPGFQRPPWEQH